MKISNWTNPQFVDATGISGLNAAFGLASGSVSSMGSGVWAAPGLLSPESMGMTFAGMVGSVNLPQPWGIVTSGGVVVRAHGVQTGQDTTAYSVDFSGLVPGTGAVTAFLAATITSIQQNAFPLTGPPPGHPSYNPNFVPTTAYAATAYTVALAAVTGGVDNIATFELGRVNLVPGQVSIAVSGVSTRGWQRAAAFQPAPISAIASGGALSLTQSALTVVPTTLNLTSTLPPAASGGGLFYRLVNPATATNWTVAAGIGNTIAGTAGTPVSSVGIPPYGAMTVWGNAASGQWEVTDVNPLMMASLPNIFTAPQTIIDSSVAAFTIQGTGAGGANIRMLGNGSTTPAKTLRVINGQFQVVNSAGSAVLSTLDDSGNYTIPGSLSAGANATVAGSGSYGNGLTVAGGGVYVNGIDAGGMQLRTALGTGPGAGFRNDGTTLYLLMSNNGQPTGAFNGFRPLTINLFNGAMNLDSTGAGVSFGGTLNGPNVTTSQGNIGGVSMTGGGVLTANGGIFSAGQISGNTVSAAGNITANARLRAGLGAFNSGDVNAAIILSDFNGFVGGSPPGSYIYKSLPDGTTLQAYAGASATGIGDFIAFPQSFNTGGIEVVVIEGAPAGWYNGTGSVQFLTVFGVQSITRFGFTLYVGKVQVGGGMSAGPGIAYRYIAIGY